MQVGDSVNYVPAECHALHKRCGEWPWKLGWKVTPEIRDPSGKVRVQEKVVVLERDEEIADKLRMIRHAPYGDAVRREQLVLLHPINCWPAVVRAVRDKTHVDLDIDCGGGGTLHYDNVEVDPEKNAHTCHVEVTL